MARRKLLISHPNCFLFLKYLFVPWMTQTVQPQVKEKRVGKTLTDIKSGTRWTGRASKIWAHLFYYRFHGCLFYVPGPPGMPPDRRGLWPAEAEETWGMLRPLTLPQVRMSFSQSHAFISSWTFLFFSPKAALQSPPLHLNLITIVLSSWSSPDYF